MRKYLVVTLFTLLVFGLSAQDSPATLVKVGDKVPNFTIVSDNGAKMESSSLKGKVILITLFATWCPPCQQELADIQNKLWPKYKDKKDFALLVIGRQHSDAELKTYNEKKGFSFPLYPDKDRAIFDLFSSSGIPRYYLVGKNSKVVNAGMGYKAEEFDELLKAIANELKK